MEIVGIVCEYNPLHSGHQKQFEIIRSELGEDTAIVCLMSGNYVQRGAPAVFHKSLRAKAAVLAGADLVLELPFPYSSAPAEIFGGAGVRIADSLGCVDELCFGSETGDISVLRTLSDRLGEKSFKEALSAYLEKN